MLECIGPDLWEEALLRPMDYGHTFSRTCAAADVTDVTDVADGLRPHLLEARDGFFLRP